MQDQLFNMFLSVLLIFIYLIKASCFLQRTAQERNIGLLIFSQADAFLSSALSELKMIYILVYSKKALYFPIISLLVVQKIFRMVKASSTKQVKVSIFLFHFHDQVHSFNSSLFLMNLERKGKNTEINVPYYTFSLHIYIYIFYITENKSIHQKIQDLSMRSCNFK